MLSRLFNLNGRWGGEPTDTSGEEASLLLSGLNKRLSELTSRNLSKMVIGVCGVSNIPVTCNLCLALVYIHGH